MATQISSDFNVVANLLQCDAVAFELQEYPMFHTSDGRKVIENLDEFDDAREVVSGLAAEYQACERPDYVSQGLNLMFVPA